MIEGPIVIFGGSGKLGQELLKQNPQYIAPTHREVDIVNYQQVSDYLNEIMPKCVINAAAIVGLKESEQDKPLTYRVNVKGAKNIAGGCRAINARIVYVSSVSVFNGSKGMYKEDDAPSPTYYYGLTKLSGEQVTTVAKNYAIIRTDFFTPGLFKYKQIFTDHYCSKLPISGAATLIGKIAESTYRGVIHIGSPRDTIFNILHPFDPNITGITIKESTMPQFPKDLSLDTSVYQAFFT